MWENNAKGFPTCKSRGSVPRTLDASFLADLQLRFWISDRAIGNSVYGNLNWAIRSSLKVHTHSLRCRLCRGQCLWNVYRNVSLRIFRGTEINSLGVNFFSQFSFYFPLAGRLIRGVVGETIDIAIKCFKARLQRTSVQLQCLWQGYPKRGALRCIACRCIPSTTNGHLLADLNFLSFVGSFDFFDLNFNIGVVTCVSFYSFWSCWSAFSSVRCTFPFG